VYVSKEGEEAQDERIIVVVVAVKGTVLLAMEIAFIGVFSHVPA